MKVNTFKTGIKFLVLCCCSLGFISAANAQSNENTDPSSELYQQKLQHNAQYQQSNPVAAPGSKETLSESDLYKRKLEHNAQFRDVSVEDRQKMREDAAIKYEQEKMAQLEAKQTDAIYKKELAELQRMRAEFVALGETTQKYDRLIDQLNAKYGKHHLIDPNETNGQTGSK